MECKDSKALITSKDWFLEKNKQWPGVCTGLKVSKVLSHKKTLFQDLMVFDTENFGKVLILDGVIQVTQRDEFIYHEMMSHLPLMCHPNNNTKTKSLNVIVIGGGDGGVVSQLIKHSSINKIYFIEIDKDVISESFKYFPNISCIKSYNNGKFVPKDPRVEVIVDDGYNYIKDHIKTDSIDVIIVDSSDPVGPASVLFGKRFYDETYRVLRENGILCCQGECMFAHLELISNSLSFLKEVGYTSVNYNSFYLPTYPFGQIGSIIARKEGINKVIRPLSEPCGKINDQIGKTLKYYNENTHRASFVLPSFVVSKL